LDGVGDVQGREEGFLSEKVARRHGGGGTAKKSRRFPKEKRKKKKSVRILKERGSHHLGIKKKKRGDLRA